MASFAMTDCYIGFGTSTATDRSTLIKSVTLNVDAATLDTTDFGEAIGLSPRTIDDAVIATVRASQ